MIQIKYEPFNSKSSNSEVTCWDAKTNSLIIDSPVQNIRNITQNVLQMPTRILKQNFLNFNEVQANRNKVKVYNRMIR